MKWIKFLILVCLSLSACTVGIVERQVVAPATTALPTLEPASPVVPDDPATQPSPTATPILSSDGDCKTFTPHELGTERG